MTARGTAALYAIVLVLAALVWLTTPGPETAGEPRGLLNVESRDRVARLEWVEADRRIELARDGRGWSDEQGRRFDGGEADDLLEALATVHPLTTIEVAADEAAGYGLDRPRRLRLLDAERRVLFDIAIGRRNPAATGLYVRLNGSDDVLMVGALLDWELAKLSRAAAGGESEALAEREGGGEP
jgi:hypothetical protein